MTHEERRLLYLPVRLVQPGASERGRTTVALQELAASIREVGVLQPLTVRRQNGQFVVVSGNRRLLAARIAGLGEVPCIVTEAGPTDRVLIALTENLQREDLSYFDEAELLRQYLRRSGLSQAQAARRLGRSQSAVANKLRLLGHTPRVRQALQEQGLSERHARELLRVTGESARLAVLSAISGRRLSVAQLETYIDAYLRNGLPPASEKLRRRDIGLFLDRVARGADALRTGGVRTELAYREEPDQIVLTVRIEKRADRSKHDPPTV